MFTTINPTLISYVCYGKKKIARDKSVVYKNVVYTIIKIYDKRLRLIRYIKGEVYFRCSVVRAAIDQGKCFAARKPNAVTGGVDLGGRYTGPFVLHLPPSCRTSNIESDR